MNTETLPWHLQYASFAGTLPNIAAITHNLIRESFSLNGEIFGVEVVCRYTAASAGAIDNRESRGAITSQRPDESITVVSETRGCPSGRYSGTGSVMGLGNTTAVVVTLI
jgi:hypothetical protein